MENKGSYPRKNDAQGKRATTRSLGGRVRRMKFIYSCTTAMLAILAGVAIFRPYVVKAGPNSLAAPKSAVSPAAIAGQKVHWAENYGKLPLGFEANQGQTDSRVKFLSRGRGYSLFLTGDEAVLTLKKPSVVSGQSSVGKWQKPGVRSQESAATGSHRATDHGPWTTDAVLRLRLVGANAGAKVEGAEELPGKSNYFIGNDPKKWRTNVPNYAQVKYHNVYPGVDLVYYGTQGGQLEYDFVVAPDADPRAIRLALSGGVEVGRGQFKIQDSKLMPMAASWSRPATARFVSTSPWFTNPR